jgi:O-antigen ligase
MIGLLLSKGRLKSVMGSVLAVGSIILFVMLALPRLGLVQIWVNRMQSLLVAPQQITFNLRVEAFKSGFNEISTSPIWGLGLSPQYIDFFNSETGYYSSDVGFLNTLLALGVIGLIVVGILIVTVLFHSYQYWKKMPDSQSRGYMLGIIGLWVAVVVGYLFAMDSFTRSEGIWMVSLVMALVDRLGALQFKFDGT